MLDYSKAFARARLTRYTNLPELGMAGMEELTAFLSKTRASALGDAPATRWLRVEGFSWAVVKMLALHYGLPPHIVSDVSAGKGCGGKRSRRTGRPGTHSAACCQRHSKTRCTCALTSASA